jgi:hypothetical protein
MAKFLKVKEAFEDGRKYVTYINLDNISLIQDEGDDGGTLVFFVGGKDDYCSFNIPLSDFMDLVNSQK